MNHLAYADQLLRECERTALDAANNSNVRNTLPFWTAWYTARAYANDLLLIDEFQDAKDAAADSDMCETGY